jgi:hypothetical protein
MLEATGDLFDVLSFEITVHKIDSCLLLRKLRLVSRPSEFGLSLSFFFVL